MKQIKLLSFLLFLLMILACNRKNDQLDGEASDDILINQIGYQTNAEKKALIRIDADEFKIRTVDGEEVFAGKTGPWKYWEPSGDSVRLIDFSSFMEPGEYVLCINDTEYSHPFKIGSHLYKDVSDAVLKSYYFARCGVDLDSAFAGAWHRKAGHPDTSVVVHISAADGFRPKGTIISSPGGWYDAGDYGKYIVNSGISTYTLLLSSELNKEYHQNQNLNIPESDNEVPDILDEILVNLKWMLSMQDPNDGGVYHKLTTKNFVGFVMPDQTTDQRYVVQKSTAAALDFAATMAHSVKILQSYGMNGLADQAMQAAEAAYQWALRHPDIYYHQPEDINTGAYGDNSLVDEWYWASAEMYLTNTRSRNYFDGMLDHWQKTGTPTWNNVNSLGIISLLISDEREKFANVESDFLAYIDQLLDKGNVTPYLISVDKFAWGSNSDVANEGMLKLIAFHLTGDEKYLASARNDLDYLLGRNATAYSFITGYGSKSPMHPHQRISSADGVEDPMPGYLVGGPNINVMTDCDPNEVVRSKFPAASYTDTECSYSTNETAINWNAPLVFLVSALDNIDR
ncbi:MAG TPA: glycoside hydrolase family 9 protein [Draconibacterium sp.]|nr:glycoside hydrolase family 9 protein [Draconibacterium sp.]